MTKLIFLLLFVPVSSFAGWKEDIIEAATRYYSPLAQKKFNKKFSLTIAQNDTVAGSADHGFSEITVTVFSGALATSRLTPDALRMLICHELGHIFGGDPKKNIPYEWEGPIGPDGLSLLSAEGQADDYAARTCFRLLTDSNVSSLRIAEAGLQFLNLVKDFPISIDTPDPTITPQLIRDSYPSRQCRLDTIVRAARGESRPKCWYK